MRSDYQPLHSPTAYGPGYSAERALPLPQNLPQQVAEPIRRHSSQYEDPSRAYNGYAPRDAIMKQDPGLEQRPQPDVMRPNSTGHHPLHRPRPVDEMRPVYDHPAMSNGSLSTAPYMPPPPQYGPERAYYEPAMSEAPREHMQYPIEFTSSSSSGQKKRSARTTQACEACRHAKAKCTDPKPCQGCVEKNIDCKYDPPPPKQ